MSSNVGGVVAGLSVFTGLAVALGVISTTGYDGNAKFATTSQVIPTVPTLPAAPAENPPPTPGEAEVTSAPQNPPDDSAAPDVGTIQQNMGNSPATETPPTETTTFYRLRSTRRSLPKSRIYPASDRDILIVIAAIIGFLILVSAVAAILTYRYKQRRRRKDHDHFAIRSVSSAGSGVFPGGGMMEENDYFSSASTSTPSDIYFDAMKQIPLHRPPDAFMACDEFNDADDFVMGGPGILGTGNTLTKSMFGHPGMHQHSTIPPYSTMAKQNPPFQMDSAVLEYPQEAAPYPGPYFINPPPHY